MIWESYAIGPDKDHTKEFKSLIDQSYKSTLQPSTTEDYDLFNTRCAKVGSAIKRMYTDRFDNKNSWFDYNNNHVVVVTHAAPAAGFIHYMTGVSFEEINRICTCGITKINLDTFLCEFIDYNSHLIDVGVKDSYQVMKFYWGYRLENKILEGYKEYEEKYYTMANGQWYWGKTVNYSPKSQKGVIYTYMIPKGKVNINQDSEIEERVIDNCWVKFKLSMQGKDLLASKVVFVDHEVYY